MKKRGRKKVKIILKSVVKRKKDYLYYIDAKGNIREAKMARGRKKKKEEKKTEKQRKEEKKRQKKKGKGWFGERRKHALAAQGIKVRKKELAGYGYIYALFFFMAMALAIATFLKKDFFSFGIAALTLFLSIVFYIIIVTRKKKIGFVIYVIVWITALFFSVLSILKRNYLSLAISLVVMFLTSLTASLMIKKLRREKIITIMRELMKKKKKTETDIDNLLLLFKQFKKLKISEIALAFDIDIKKAEEWCKILEEHELGTMYYPAFGETKLKWKEK